MLQSRLFLQRRHQKIIIASYMRRHFSTPIATKNENALRKAITQKWLDTIVIGEKLCPFAPPVSNEPKLRIHVSNAPNHDNIIQEIYSEACLLINPAEEDCVCEEEDKHDRGSTFDCRSKGNRPETTLVVLNEYECPSLLEFRDLIYLSWRVQEECILQNGFEKEIQIVLFHPLAVHETYSTTQETNDDDSAAVNYTIRSPFPIIHLLREIDVFNAVKSGYKDLEGLPSRNKAKLQSLGLQVCQQKLRDCFKEL